MNSKIILSVVLVTSLMFSCNLKQKPSGTEQPDMHTSQNSLSWDGVYYGLIPCASCPGIEVFLTINSDNSYEMTEVYLESGDEAGVKSNGNFKWSEDGSTIDLIDSEAEVIRKYKVEENRLRQLDTEGNIIEGDLASNYLLFKSGNMAVEDQKWKLIELTGQKVEGDADNFFLIFDSETRRIQAKAGCNIIQFEYLIVNNHRLITKPGLSTLMACPDDTEERLVAAILSADNITYGENNLSINKARMAPLARFELVEE